MYHLDLTTGALEKIVENRGFVGWVVDDDLKVRAAVTPTPDGGMVILVRDDEASDWRPRSRYRRKTRKRLGHLALRRMAQACTSQTSIGSNTGRLVKMDIATGAVEVIAEDPTYDITGVIINPDSREIEGVLVYGDRRSTASSTTRCAPTSSA